MLPDISLKVEIIKHNNKFQENLYRNILEFSMPT